MTVDIEGFQDRWVCYLDVLGFSESVIKAESSIDERLLLARIQKILRNENLKNESSDIRVTQFSDSLVMSVTRNANSLLFMIKISRLMTGTMLREGFLTRGGIAGGAFVHTDEAMFGTPLVCIVKNFDRSGEFPHLRFSDEVVQEIEKPENSSLREWFTHDPWDGSCMLHTLAEFERYTIRRHPGPILVVGEDISKQIARNLAVSKKPEHQRKWRWMKAFWNLSVYQNEYFKRFLVT